MGDVNAMSREMLENNITKGINPIIQYMASKLFNAYTEGGSRLLNDEIGATKQDVNGKVNH